MSESFVKGTRVWLVEKFAGDAHNPEPEEVFTAAIVDDPTVFRDGKVDKITIVTEDDEYLDVPVDSLYGRNPKILEGTDDLTVLSLLHEPAVLHNLEQRYRLNQIYTFSSTILIALNPYQQLPIYQDEYMRGYAQQPIDKLQPHVYSLAEQAYRSMLTERRNQSILVSGESGAGKTETTKFLLRYFAAMGTTSERSIEYKVVKSTPILEAFGNAQTLRNDNSSRFGKWLEVQFDRKGNIIGANLRTYLLEKSRLVKIGEGERNYHIFYQLCAGASDELKERFQLASADTFHYLSQSDNIDIPGVDDSKVFEKTKEALSVLGITEEEQENIFSVLAAILHIGNVTFEESGDEAAVIVNEESVSIAAKLLGMPAADIGKTFTQRKVSAGSEVYFVPLNVDDAEGARDSLSMLLYSRLFDWLVLRINKSINNVSGKMENFIGVLDIYGFETFLTNSFEQFCINYANEVLQQQFNQHIFKLEQEEYKKEKIGWTDIEFNDNQPCLDLIEQPMGILKILDEECRFPKATADTFTQKLYTNVGKEPNFYKPRFSNLEFGIKHYAGDVTYSSDSFLIKNKDFVIPLQLTLITKSTNKFVKSLKAPVVKKPATPPKGRKGGRRGGGRGRKYGLQSVALQFKDSLATLMTTIHATSPHYIRCIKPNEEKKPLLFNKNTVLRQLRCGGVIESIRICRAGFPTRRKYDFFYKRYNLLVKNFPRPTGSNFKESVELLVERIELDPARVRFGLTKIFMKTGELAELEQRRTERLSQAVTIIQKNWRCFRQRRIYVETKRCIHLLQSLWKRSLAYQLVSHKRDTKAATALQCAIRSYNARVHLHTCLSAALLLQQVCRRRNAQCLLVQYRREKAATTLSSQWRGFVARKYFARLRKGTVYAQCLWRRKQAVRLLRALKVEARQLSNIVKQKRQLEKRAQMLETKFQTEAEEKKRIEQELEMYKAKARRIEAEQKEKAEIKRKQSQADERLKGLLEKTRAELEESQKAKDDTAEKLVETTTKFEAQLDDKDEQILALQKEMEEMKRTHQAEIDRLKEQHKKELDALRNKSNKREEHWRKEQEKLHAEHAQHLAEERERSSRHHEAELEVLDDDNDEPEQVPSHEKRLMSMFESPKPRRAFESPPTERNLLKSNGFGDDDMKAAKSKKSVKLISPDGNVEGKEEAHVWRAKYKSLADKYNTLKTTKSRRPASVDITTMHEKPTFSAAQYATVGNRHGRGITGNQDELDDKSQAALIDKLATLRRENDKLLKTLRQRRDVRTMFNTSGNGSNGPTNGVTKQAEALSNANTEAYITKNLETVLGAGFSSQKMLVDNALRCQFEENGEFCFVNEIPTPAFVIFRCLVFWKCLITGDQSTVLQSSRILSYVPKALNECIKGSEQDSASMAYWLSTLASLLHLIRQSRAVERPGLARDELAEDRIKKMIHTLGRLLLRTFSSMGNKLISNIKPHLLHLVSGNAQASVDNIKLYLKRYLAYLQRARVQSSIASQFFAQMFSLMNQIIFNTILLQRDLCSFSVAVKTKMHLSLLNAELTNLDKGTKMIPKMEDYMKETYQLTCLLALSNKANVVKPSFKKGICPDLTLVQLKQVFSMYNLNCDEFESPIPDDVIAAIVLDPAYNVDQSVLLESIDFTFTAKRLHHIQLAKVQKWKYTDELVNKLVNTKRSSQQRPKSGFFTFWRRESASRGTAMT